MGDTTGKQAADLLQGKLGDRGAADELIGLGFDFCLDQDLGRYLSAERLLANLDRVSKSPLLVHLLTKHLRPSIDREAVRAGGRKELVEEYLTEEAKRQLDVLAGRPVHLEPELLESVMGQEAVRHLIRMIVIETINRFIGSLKGEGGLFGKVGKLGVAAGLLKKLGGQIEAGLQSAAASFVQGSLDLVMKTVVQTVAGPEMAAHMGDLGQAGFRAALRFETAAIWAAALRQPLDDLLALIPGLLQHNLKRETIRQAILAEVAAALEVEKDKPLRQVIADEDLISAWRSEVVQIGGALVTDFSQDNAFRSWLEG